MNVELCIQNLKVINERCCIDEENEMLPFKFSLTRCTIIRQMRNIGYNFISILVPLKTRQCRIVLSS